VQTDISRTPTNITPAPTDVSLGHTFAGGVRIYWGFAIKWIWPHPSGSHYWPGFQKIDAIPTMRQEKEVNRETREIYEPDNVGADVRRLISNSELK
jgi:hypothetical protein